ncbi:MAG: hypothetical protein K2X01_00120 [Cyanobacteria bacterium]|nr:hypothetical protein [Cyanobacteriota bacterium]
MAQAISQQQHYQPFARESNLVSRLENLPDGLNALAGINNQLTGNQVTGFSSGNLTGTNYIPFSSNSLNMPQMSALPESNQIVSKADSSNVGVVPVNNAQEAVQALNKKLGEARHHFDETKSEQGWLGKFWDGVKNTVGASPKDKAWYNPVRWWGWLINSDKGSATVEKNMNQAQNKLNRLNTLTNQSGRSLQEEQEMQALYKELAGQSLDETLRAGGLRLETKEGGAQKSVIGDLSQQAETYEKSQQSGVNFFADLTAGVAVTAAVAFGVIAAPFTGGASLAVSAGALASAGLIGAGTKTAIKASDAWSGNRDYSLANFGYDSSTGFLVGAISPVATWGANRIAASAFGESVHQVGTKALCTLTLKEGTHEGIKKTVKTTTQLGYEQLSNLVTNPAEKVAGSVFVPAKPY